MDTKTKLLSIIFSFRNEEGNIEPLVKRISLTMKEIKNWKYELIFVNDDSTDKSEKILINLQKNNPIKIINMSRNFGVDPCVLAGFRNCSGDAIIYLHSTNKILLNLFPNSLKSLRRVMRLFTQSELKGKVRENLECLSQALLIG